MSVLLLRLAAVALAGSVASADAQGYRYEVIPLAEKYGISLNDINEKGVITGRTRSGIAYTLDQSNLTILPHMLGTTSSGGSKINANLDVLGAAGFGVLTKSVLWVDGKPIDLGMVRGEAGGDSATDLNDILQVSAYFDGKPAIWEKGKVEFLELPPAYLFGAAGGINNAGDCAGYAFSTDTRAARWVNGAFESLHPGGYNNSLAFEIAENGDIGGEVTRPGVHNAALWRGGTEFIDLGNLAPGTPSYFNDLNSMGQVVGQSANSLGEFRGFLWENGEMLSLTDLVEPGWTIANARAINDRGQILAGGGNGTIAGSVLLNPVPEPSSAASLGLLLFFAGILRLRRNVAATTDRLRRCQFLQINSANSSATDGSPSIAYSSI